MKNTLFAISIALFTSLSVAETFPPPVVISQQSVDDSDNGFTYPEITHLEDDALVNDVVFFYPNEMREFFDDDMEELVKYVEDAVEVNNTAFRRQDIPLRRHIASIVAIPSDLTFNIEGDRDSRVLDLKRLYNDDKYNYHFYHEASYVVALIPYNKDVVSSIGSGELGGKYSWVSPFQRGEVEQTLSHELGHNDGFTHDKEAYEAGDGDSKSYYLAAHAVGQDCGDFDSIMKSGTGSRSEGFFSSPLVTNAQGDECGDFYHGDAARAYMEAVNDYIPNQQATFHNNKPAREATGTVTLSVPSTVIAEGQDLVVEVMWDGAERGDSVQILTRKGTADITDFRSSLRTAYYNGTDATSIISLKTVDDNDFEIDETMSVELIYPHGVSISGSKTQSITITSDEKGDAGIVNFTQSSLSLEEGGIGTLTLQRTDGSDGEITVKVITELGTADADDFTAIEKDIIFADGEVSKSLTVRTTNDSIEEDAESFTILLSGKNELIGPTNEVTVTIAASDAPSSSGSNNSGSSSGSDGSGGGSTGIFSSMLLLLIALMRRSKKL